MKTSKAVLLLAMVVSFYNIIHQLCGNRIPVTVAGDTKFN